MRLWQRKDRLSRRNAKEKKVNRTRLSTLKSTPSERRTPFSQTLFKIILKHQLIELGAIKTHCYLLYVKSLSHVIAPKMTSKFNSWDLSQCRSQWIMWTRHISLAQSGENPSSLTSNIVQKSMENVFYFTMTKSDIEIWLLPQISALHSVISSLRK